MTVFAMKNNNGDKIVSKYPNNSSKNISKIKENFYTFSPFKKKKKQKPKEIIYLRYQCKFLYKNYPNRMNKK